ncbi:hypothetical protein [Herbaspirillum sp. ST 5-3]|uniref:hypothetical protein n=1 Tax=Oxalobacteraceae TaxID=75682 RepID=UPI0010A53782|nr:hypothetical protein [Herbaspirillum sp. ST 5-3]
MASGRLGASDLSATTNTSVYTVPASKVATVSVSICNRNATSVTVRLAVSTSGTPNDADYLEYDTTIDANSVLERTGIVMDETKVLVAYASGTGVSVVAYGFEGNA